MQNVGLYCIIVDARGVSNTIKLCMFYIQCTICTNYIFIPNRVLFCKAVKLYFLYQGVCHWNNLPLEIKQCPSKDTFKYQVKCLLYSRLFVQETSLYVRS